MIDDRGVAGSERAHGDERRWRRGHGQLGHPALPATVRAPLVVTAALAAVLVAALGVRYAGQRGSGRIDAAAQAAVQALWPDPQPVASLVGLGGHPALAAAIALLLAGVCVLARRGRLAVVTVVALAAAAVLTTALKPLVGRTIHGDFLAYPSGHTAAATVYGMVAMLLLVDLLSLPRAPAVLVVLAGAVTAAVVMAWAQLVQHAHYATDTVGGFGVAVVLVTALAALADRLAEPRGG